MKSKNLSLLLVFVFLGTPLLAKATTIQQLIDSVEIQDTEAFLGWKQKSDFTSEGPDAFSVPRVQVNCAQKDLFPTHPHQTTKKYHQFFTGQFKTNKVPTNSPVCRIKSGGPTPYCLQSDRMLLAVLSDVYTDRCGNLYRGFWSKVFLKQDEEMNTLVALGKSVYKNPKSEFANDMKEGPTEGVASTEFLFLTALWAQDQKEIDKSRELAIKYTHNFDPETLLFKEK